MEFIRHLGIVSRRLLPGLLFGMLGSLAWSQVPDGPTPPPPPPQAPPALDGPRTDAEALPATPEASARLGRDPAARRDQEAQDVAATSAAIPRVYVPNEPPRPIVERPSGERPDPKAVWTPGFWEWDPDGALRLDRRDWRIPPAGTVWRSGRWIHDARGWYWMPGTWRPRSERAAIAANRPAWRINGPPAEHPDDTPPPAPGPDYFYVPGHYEPAAPGDRLAWVPGFWAAVQPGWDWIPARWIRRPDGWDYRAGHWMRDPDTAIVGPVPRDALRRSRRRANVTVRARDPLTGAEVDVAADGEPVPDGAVVTGMPYYVIRPPGYPYGPGGVVVPGAVPPFVRRILNGVLP